MQDSEAVQRLPGNNQHGTRQLRDFTQKRVGPRATQPPTSQQSSGLATSRASLTSSTVPTTIPEHPDEKHAAESLNQMKFGGESRSHSTSASPSASSDRGTLFATTKTKLDSPSDELEPLWPGSGADGEEAAASAAAVASATSVTAVAHPESGGGAGSTSNANVNANKNVPTPDAAGSADGTHAAQGGSNAISSHYASRAPPSFRNYLDQGTDQERAEPQVQAVLSMPLKLDAAVDVSPPSATTVSASLVDLNPAAVELRPRVSEASGTTCGNSSSVWAMDNALFSAQAGPGEAATESAAVAVAPAMSTIAESSAASASAAILTQSATVGSSDSSEVMVPPNLNLELCSSAISAISAISSFSALSAESAMSPMTSDGASSPDRISPRPRRVFLSRQVLHASAAEAGEAANAVGHEGNPIAAVLDSHSSSQTPAGILSLDGSQGADWFARSPLGSQHGHSAAIPPALGTSDPSGAVAAAFLGQAGPAASTGAGTACYP